jgi:hypothetical protein
MSFPAKLDSFALFPLLLFQLSGHGTWCNTATMTRICEKRSYFALQEFSGKLYGQALMEKFTYNTLHGRRSKGGRYPPESDKDSEIFSGSMVISSATEFTQPHN